MRWIFVIPVSLFFVFLGVGVSVSQDVQASEFVIYSVYQALNLGNPNEVSKKDFYVNMGSAQGVEEGAVLQVLRRVSTYDEMNQQLYRDVIFPIGWVKVIHVEPNASVARLDKLVSVDDAPVMNPRAIIVGDIVQLSSKPRPK